MKNLLIAFLLVASTQVVAAVGCLPGNCCNNRPCDSVPTQPSRPNPRPQPACPTILAPKLSRFVNSCTECAESEVCGEYSNSIGEILGHRCESI